MLVSWVALAGSWPKLALVVDAQKVLPAGHGGSELDACQEAPGELSVEAVGVLGGGGEAVLHQGGPQARYPVNHRGEGETNVGRTQEGGREGGREGGTQGLREGGKVRLVEG